MYAEQRVQRMHLSALLLLGVCLLALAATVASVPTSVLAQNTELTSNMKAAAGNRYNSDNNKLISNVMAGNNNNNKVKRSSNNAQDSLASGNAGAANAAAAGLNKKSSPEIVPASFNAPPPQQAAAADAPAGAGMLSLPTNGEILNSAIAAGLTAAAVEAAAAATQREYEQQQQLYGDELYGGSRGGEDTPTLMYKRGITPQQYLYGSGAALDAGNYGNAEYYNNPFYGSAAAAAARENAGAGMSAGVPNGVWADELEPGYMYNDLQELDDYAPAPRASYRNKAYDNLQSLLNSEAYMEPVVVPLAQYPGRYYGGIDAERSKRTPSLNKYNNNKYLADMRLKRDSNKLTPADMLALVALVEAGERARKDTDADVGYPVYPAAAAAPLPERESYNPKNYYASAYDYPATVDNDMDYNGGAWLEPAVVDYYGMPVNVETLPKYELAREHKYGSSSSFGGGNSGGGNRLNAKRFMVSKKKKRSIGKYVNEPMGKSSMSYNSNGF